MKKKQSKLNLKKHVVSNLDADAVRGKGPDTVTCNGCRTFGRDCVTHVITRQNCGPSLAC